MTPAVSALLVVLALVVGVMVIGFVGQNRTTTATPTDASESWLRAARAAVNDGCRISGRITEEGDRSLPDLSDAVIDDIVSDMKHFGERIAVVSASAPTAMDTRVCREVGVRAHSLANVYERELRLRNAFDAEPRSTLAGDTVHDPAGCLEEFIVALHDLEQHVELL